MKSQKLNIIFAFIILGSTIYGQSSHKLLRQGNKFYDLEEYSLAEEKYRKSQLAEDQSKTAYNLGNSLYKQGRFEEAAEAYQKASSGNIDSTQKAKVFHNLGNSQLQAQNLEEALNAYKQSVRLNPNDQETLHNLMMTQQMMKMQQQQQQQQQDGEPQDGEPQEGEQQDQEPQENDGEESQDGESQDENQSQQDSTQIQQGGEFDSTRLDKQELDSLDAIKLLEIIENEEQKVQEKLRKFNSTRKKQDKDW